MANLYRKFWFENANGDIRQLSDEESSKVFLNNPDGLGYTNSVQAVRLGNGSKLLSTTRSFPNPSGELVFYRSDNGRYEDYYNFIKFISVGGLKFYYTPPKRDAKRYYIDCEIYQLDKGQVDNSDQALRCNITITGLSFWKDADLVNIVSTNETENSGKYYDLIRDYHYEGSSLSEITINNQGSEEVGFIIEIDPNNTETSTETTLTVTNPTWALYHEDELTSYGIAQMTGTFDKVTVNSIDGYQSITLIQNGATLSQPASYQKLDYDNQGVVTFPRLKVGKTTLVFSCGSLATFAGTVTIKFNHSYASI